jgi:glucose-6-phosphate isomerase
MFSGACAKGIDMANISLDTKYLQGFVGKQDLEGIFPEVEKAHALLEKRNGPGNDFLGWIDLPDNTSEDMIKEIETSAQKLKSIADILIIVGIGGSYLGARAAISMFVPQFGERKVIFAGQNLCGDYINEMFHFLKDSDKDIAVNVISKSGTTTEPAVSFRIIEELLVHKYGKENLKDRIVCTTDKEKGALKTMALKEGYKTFVIPQDVGGRFSVLTPVGLLPLAYCGIDISELLKGAREMKKETAECDLDKNICYRYAANRNILYREGKTIEVLSNFDNRLHYFSEWWKQLFGESEGKDKKGIFPASCDFTTDLHSMGQLLKDGPRNVAETFIIENKENGTVHVPLKEENLDNLNYLAGKDVSFINKKAYEATCQAHFEGGVPNSTIYVPEINEFHLGQLFYFFERAVAVSAYISGVNPFNQPGVESYKQKMFKLLGKP